MGSTLDPVILDAALRLGSLRPADLGTAATKLAIRLDDQDGFVMTADPVGWSATFGFYTPTLRTTDLIPGQVRLLRSLLAGREDEVAADHRWPTTAAAPTCLARAPRRPGRPSRDRPPVVSGDPGLW